MITEKEILDLLIFSKFIKWVNKQNPNRKFYVDNCQRCPIALYLCDILNPDFIDVNYGGTTIAEFPDDEKIIIGNPYWVDNFINNFDSIDVDFSTKFLKTKELKEFISKLDKRDY